MITGKEFQRAAASLKHAAPHEWDTFMRAFEAYTQTTIEAVVSAPLESVVLHQGFARQCQKLLTLYTECDPKPKGD